MRERLCEATLDALTQVGYDKMSTPLICKIAGVSRGALTHHFASRNALVAAAFEHLLDSWRGERENLLALLGPDGTMSLSDQTEFLWEKTFGSPRYVAALELMLAARMDEDLARDLRAVLAEWRDERDALTQQALGVDDDDDDAIQMIRLNLCMLRGIAVHMSFDDSEAERMALLAAWRKFLEANADRLPGGSGKSASTPPKSQ
jgi:AcrR family transcriptional regulator